MAPKLTFRGRLPDTFREVNKKQFFVQLKQFQIFCSLDYHPRHHFSAVQPVRSIYMTLMTLQELNFGRYKNIIKFALSDSGGRVYLLVMEKFA